MERGTARSETRDRVAWIAAATSVFALATGLLYTPLLSQDLRQAVPAIGDPAQGRNATTWDRRFVVWLVARNAYAWVHHPWRLFDTGTCHPEEDALALGHPALSVGLLGAPAEVVFADPILTYNSALLLQTLLAAFAMYLLVADWTRERAAGVAAGLAYAFLEGKTGQVLYPFHGDTAWTLLACFFARRLFAGGGLRDGLGFAAGAALQMSASFYTFLAAVCLGLPVGLWLLRAYGLAQLRRWPTIIALALSVIAAFAIFAPFLEQRGTAFAARGAQSFATLATLRVSLFASLPVATLALLGCLLPRRLGTPELPASPRFALAAGAALAAVLGTWSGAYAALAAWIPGLDTVRVPLLLLGGLHLGWSALAGLGAAALLRWLPGSANRRIAWAALLLTVLFLDVTRPPLTGLPPRRGLTTVEVRPPEAALDFFAELERRGSHGPLLEAPIDYRVARHGLEGASRAVLLQTFHRRRTSACYNSFVPESVHALGPLAAALPAREALEALRARGFTTLLVRNTLQPADRRWRQRIARAAEAGLLVPIHTGAGFAAYSLLE